MVGQGGPARHGGFQEYVIPDNSSGEGWAIRFYPDIMQTELENAGQAPKYYWAPQQLRLAQFPDTGDYKFSHVHFAGVLTEDANVGVETELETVGGLLAFTTTSQPPPAVMQQAEAQLHERIRGNNDPLWRWSNQNRRPDITMVPINENRTTISSLAPDASPLRPDDGAGGGAAPRGERELITRRGIRHGRDLRSRERELGAWHVQLDGQGAGSTTGGENAYGGLLGMIPSELVWTALHGGATPFTVSQHLLIPMATPAATISIHGNWRQVYEHFSGQAKGSYLFFSAEISAEVENLRRSGALTVRVVVDTTVPNAAEIQKQMEEDKDLIVNQFLEAAKKTIFEPAAPDEKAAEAQSRPGPWSVGLAFKLVRKQIDLDLRYEEERIFKYNYPDTISSQLEGLRRRIKASPDEESKYFQRVILGNLGTKLRRIVRPVFGEEDPAARMVVEFGYPSTETTLAWKGTEFTRGGGPEQNWIPEWVQLRPGEAKAPPADWQPDVTYLRRSVFFDQSSATGRNLNNRTIVETDQMRLDPQGGTPTSEMAVDVRSNDGMLDVTLFLGAYLSASNERVEVEIRPHGKTIRGADRPTQRFMWNENDQSEPRRLRIYTGQPDYQPRFDYRVRCMVLAPLGKPGGQDWTGPWLTAVGGDVLTVTIPDPDGEGVTRRSLTKREARALRAGLDPAETAVDDGLPAQDGEAPAGAGAGTGTVGSNGNGNGRIPTGTDGSSTWPVSRPVREARRAPRATPPVSGYKL
ncbi:hypothetical protein [Streptomyces flaveus]|uniref:Uncharacterized protein n=1 Tax=Streptomyces flaveus TaxID=66370 RepID=A0A917RFH3_9ACTN|nr:hypothetical protein [Streptomyces flaveus]GGL05504.1 hypothetical protein GCM10010094_77860 [Streptomyces flaveus]